MTREEALKRIIGEEEYKKGEDLMIDDLVSLINEIYDDFEYKCGNCKICRNCKHNLQCDIQESLCGAIGDRVYIDFGCNRFERRENER